MLDFGFYEMERKGRITVQIVPLSGALLDAETPLFFICRACQKTYGFYSNFCCGEAVQPVVLVKAFDTAGRLDSPWRVVRSLKADA